MSRVAGLRQGGGNLPYFLDSNVLIGYYFHAADAWGAAATEVFDDPEPNHTSTGVWAECFGDGTGGRCHTIEQGLVREFRRAIAHLKRAGSMDSLIAEAEARGWRTVPLLRSVAGLCREHPAGMLLVVKEQYEALCRQRRPAPRPPPSSWEGYIPMRSSEADRCGQGCCLWSHSRIYLPPTGTNRSGFFTESYSRISSSSSAIQGRFFGSSFLTRTPCHRPWPST